MDFLNYLKDNKSPIQRIISTRDYKDAGKFALQSGLIKNGKVRETARDIVNGLDKAEKIYDFATSGKAESKASRQEIIDSRFASNLDTKKYSTEVTPDGKITDIESTQSGSLIYPPDLGEYYLSFNFMKYERPNRLVAAKSVSEQIIHLPIPMNLTESHAMAWAEDRQGFLGNLANSAEAAAEGESTAEESAQASGISAAYQLGTGFATGILAKIPIINQLGVDSAINMVGQELGAIPNPQLSMIFQGPTFRDLSFGWRFNPQSAKESDLIREIIQQFRKRALPGIAFNDTNDLLSYPNIIECTLNVGDHKNEYLYQMKKCVVTGFNVNYAPNGRPSFFAGTQAPTFIEFSVALREIEYFLAEDFGAAPSTQSLVGRAEEIIS